MNDKLFRGMAIVMLLLINVVCLCSVACAETLYRSNVLTAQHQFAPGAQVGIIVPSGSVISRQFIGFEIPGSGASIIIAEQRGAYTNNIVNYTADYFRLKGYNYIGRSDVVLNAAPAQLFQLSRVKDGGGELGVWMLVLGDSRRTISIEGVFPKGSSISETIKKSLLTAMLQVNRVQNLAVGFSVSPQGTVFKFGEEIAGIRFYTINGKPVSNPIDEAVFNVGKINASVPAQEQKKFAMNLIDQKFGVGTYSVLSSNPVTRGGLSGLEVTCDMSGVKVRNRASGISRTRVVQGVFFQVTLIAKDGVYVMQGTAVRQPNEYLPQFKRIASTFQIK